MATSPSSDQQTENASTNISLHELLQFGSGIVEVICQRLNPPKFIPTEDRLSRDWKGLAVLLNFSAEEISCFSSDVNSTLSLLKKWSEKEKCPVKKLLQLLERLDRFDVADDICDLLKDGINVTPEFNNSIFNTQEFVLSPEDREALSKGKPLVNYQAYILYANEDVDFASMLVKKMEEEYSPPLKIFAKDRDLAVGSMDYNFTMRMIAERCNRLIVVLSRAFLASPENSFFINFAQTIGIDQRRRKIIPCILSNCEIPTELKPLHMLDYRRPPGPLYNFWDKLYKSISSPTIDPSVLPMLNSPSSTNTYSIAYNGSNTISTPDYNNTITSDISLNSLTASSDPGETINASATDLSTSTKKTSKILRRLTKLLPKYLKDHRKKGKLAATS